MKNQPTPTLNKLIPVVAALPEEFTIKDIMAASGMPENPVRGALMGMKSRGWVENTGKRIGPHGGQALWTRTHWFGSNRVACRENEQRAALDWLGNIMAGWRVAP